MLAGDVQHAAARHDHGQQRSGPDQANELRTGLGHLLEVVRDQQELPAREPRGEGLRERLARVLGHAESLSDGRQHEGRLTESRQLGDRAAVREEPPALGGEEPAPAGFPAPAGTDQGHEPNVVAQHKRS